jgi:uncharacterized protein (DUF2141 family)
MKNDWKKLIAITYTLLLMLFFNVQATTPYKAEATCHMKVTVTNIRNAKGHIRVAIYNHSANFLDSKKYYSIQAVPTNGQGAVTLDFALPYGDYAFTAYHDINDDRNLDRSIGVPEEPYAISNTSVKWRKPSFNECKIAVNQNNQQVYLNLRLWSE